MKLLRVIDFIYLTLGILSFLIGREYLKLLLLIGGIYFLLSGLYKTYSLGMDTTRGKFWLFFSGFGLLGPGIYMNLPILSILGRFLLLIAVFLMFLGIWNQGFRLKGKKLLIFLLAGLPVVLITFPFAVSKGAVYILLWFIDIVIFLLILHNFLAFIGGDLGKRWLIGLIAVSFYLIGELLYFSGAYDLSALAYISTFFLINFVAHIEE